MSYRTYSEYKDTGLDWLGKIPSEWGVKPFWTLYSRVKRTGHEDAQLLSVYRDYGVIPKSSRDDNNNKESEDLSGYQLVKRRDLAMNKMKAWQGSLGVSSHNGIVSPAYFVFEANHQQYDRYLHYLMRSPRYITGYLSLSKGIRVNQWDLDPQYHSRMPILLPSIGEQTQIANFLDRETAKIDTLIEKQQHLIKLLQEKRQAVISHSVTKGLNPNAKMKDSGIEWLGEVPENWAVGALGYYSTLNTGATPDRSKPEYWGGDIPWIKTGEVRYRKINSTEEYITLDGVNNSSVQMSPPGTLVMAMYGQGVTRARVAILGVSATYNQACVAINANEKVGTEFLQFFFMAAYHAIRDGGNETSQMNLNADIVSKFKIVVPDAEEQLEIVSYLNDKLPNFDRLLHKAEEAIGLMKERRTALISAAVTGKIDVRNAA